VTPDRLLRPILQQRQSFIIPQEKQTTQNTCLSEFLFTTFAQRDIGFTLLNSNQHPLSTASINNNTASLPAVYHTSHIRRNRPSDIIDKRKPIFCSIIVVYLVNNVLI
jgi:hypothetical protein